MRERRTVVVVFAVVLPLAIALAGSGCIAMPEFAVDADEALSTSPGVATGPHDRDRTGDSAGASSSTSTSVPPSPPSVDGGGLDGGSIDASPAAPPPPPPPPASPCPNKAGGLCCGKVVCVGCSSPGSGD